MTESEQSRAGEIREPSARKDLLVDPPPGCRQTAIVGRPVRRRPDEQRPRTATGFAGSRIASVPSSPGASGPQHYGIPGPAMAAKRAAPRLCIPAHCRMHGMGPEAPPLQEGPSECDFHFSA
jgi:hypothetical protein